MAGTARATALDLSTLSIGGSSVLTDLKEASIAFDIGSEESSILTRTYESHSATARSAIIKTKHMSVISAPTKATNLDISAFTLGGTDYLGNCESGSISVEWMHGEGKGLGDAWLYPVLIKKRISGEATLLVPATSGAMLALKAGNSTLADLNIAMSVTINSIAFTFGGLLKSLEHMFSSSEVQKHKITIDGRSTDSGTFPAAPTGTTTLPEIFLNTTAALTFSGVSKASGGVTYGGNILPKSMQLSWSNSGLVTLDYEFASQGEITAA